jgi:Mg/Co/Ni transporter MgtE
MRRIGAFAYDFVIGDDWAIAVIVVVAVALAAVVAALGGPAWPVVLVGAMGALVVSVRRGRRA